MNEEAKSILVEQCNGFKENLELRIDEFLILDDDISEKNFIVVIDPLQREFERIKLGKEETLNGVVNNIDRVLQGFTGFYK